MNATEIHGLFPDDYAAARAAFVDAARTVDARQVSFEHPRKGPNGEALSLDLAAFGAPDAPDILLISSGTHGVEGFAGSGIQRVLLEDGLPGDIPDSMQLLLAHAVNPHGFAWRRRVNEDNVDLNRNFIDHTVPYPVNDGYEELAHMLPPEEWNEESPGQITAMYVDALERHGPEWLQAALQSGQYAHPQGLFYGGRGPTWSNLRIQQIAERFIAGAKRLIFIDIHTALGDYGTAQMITEYEEGSALHRASRDMWGERAVNAGGGDSVSAPISGSMIAGMKRTLPDVQVIGGGLEYGTVPTIEVGMAMIADHWLHEHGDLSSPQAEAIKSEMMRVFFPDEIDWCASVVNIAREVMAQTIGYVKASPS